MGRSPVLYLLLLSIVADDLRTSIFNPSIVHSVAEMLTSDNNGVRTSSAELLRALAPLHDVLPVSTLESDINPALVRMLDGDDSLRMTVAKLILAFAPRGRSLVGSICSYELIIV